MKKTTLVFLISAALLLPIRLLAGQGNGHSNGNGHGNGHGKGNPHAQVTGNGWQTRGQYEYRTYSSGNVPPGWSKGKKTGWGNCGMPPGQAKKYGCQTYSYQGTPYYYYRDDAGQIVVRRPRVHIEGSVDIP